MKKCVKCGNTFSAKNFGLCKDDAQKIRSGFYFFNFPNTAKLRKEWAKKLELSKSLKLTSKDVVCSAHFTFDESSQMARKAREGSVERLESDEDNKSPSPESEAQQEADDDNLQEENETEEIPVKEIEDNPTVINGVAMFACGACPALYAHRSALDDHIALRGSSWNSTSHLQHFKGLVKACRKLARDPTACDLTMEDGVPAVKKLRSGEHNYSNLPRRVDGENVSLPEKVFPDLVMKPSYKVSGKKPLSSVRSTVRGAQRRKDLDCILLRLIQDAGEKETRAEMSLLPKKNGFLRVLKDGRVMRERSFIT